MLNTLKNIFNINMSNRINFTIYYFKRIPLIGKLLKDTVYKELGIKKIISIFVLITKVVKDLIGPILYAGITIYLPIFFRYRDYSFEEKYSVFTYLLFILNFLFGLAMGSGVLSPDKEKFICIKLMKMNAKDYGISIIFGQNIWRGICFLAPLVILSTILGGTVFQGTILTLLLTVFRFMGDALHLFIFERKGVILCKNYIFIIIYGILTLIVAYVPVIYGVILPVDKYLFNTINIIITIMLGIIVITYILNYKFYFKAFNITNKVHELYIDEHEINEISFSDVKINENEFKNLKLNLQKYNHKKGYDYLNTIFFDRHKKILYRPMFIQLIIIGILFLAGLIVQIIFPSAISELIEKIDNAIPGFLLIMYLISSSRRITKAMFYNCDISLLRYGFYRDRKVILRNFKIRLFKVAFINLIPALAISVSIMIIVILNGIGNLSSVSPMLLMILILSLFFTVHDLFLYYIMQPYTTELNIKNPFFNIINGLIFWICYLSSKIKTPPVHFVGIVLGITILYIIIALFSIYKFSEKTFKVK